MSKFVYNFVHSMTSREKAYFKSFSKRFGNEKPKNYMLLFTHFLNASAYDGQEIKTAFQGHPIITNWSSEVSYLQHQLLKCMINFHWELSPKMKIQKSILYCELLIEKGFPKQAYKILKKTKASADQNEDFTNILKLIELEEEILFREGIIDFTKKLSALREERQFISDKISNLNQLRLMREQIREFQFQDARSIKENLFPNSYENELLEDKTRVLSKKAMEHWLYIKAMQHFLLLDFKQSRQADLETILFMEQNEAVFKPAKLLVPISNYLYCSAMLLDKVGFDSMIQRIRSMESNSGLDKVYVAYIRLVRTLEFYCKSRDLDAIQKTIDECIPFLNEQTDNLEVAQKNNLYFLSIRGCVMLEKYELGVELLNKIIKFGVLTYAIIQSRLLLLILYYELNWTDLIKAEVESSYRLFKRHKVHNELSKVFLKFFKNTISAPQRKMLHFEKLIDKLQKIKASNQFFFDLDFFHYEEWAQQKKDELVGGE